MRSCVRPRRPVATTRRVIAGRLRGGGRRRGRPGRRLGLERATDEQRGHEDDDPEREEAVHAEGTSHGACHALEVSGAPPGAANAASNAATRSALPADPGGRVSSISPRRLHPNRTPGVAPSARGPAGLPQPEAAQAGRPAPSPLDIGRSRWTKPGGPRAAGRDASPASAAYRGCGAFCTPGRGLDQGRCRSPSSFLVKPPHPRGRERIGGGRDPGSSFRSSSRTTSKIASPCRPALQPSVCPDLEDQEHPTHRADRTRQRRRVRRERRTGRALGPSG